jgi:hypothetical protein
MTKAQIRKALRALSDEKAKEILGEIAIDCVQEGRKMLNSSEILDCICDTLRQNGLDG